MPAAFARARAKASPPAIDRSRDRQPGAGPESFEGRGEGFRPRPCRRATPTTAFSPVGGTNTSDSGVPSSRRRRKPVSKPSAPRTFRIVFPAASAPIVATSRTRVPVRAAAIA